MICGRFQCGSVVIVVTEPGPEVAERASSDRYVLGVRTLGGHGVIEALDLPIGLRVQRCLTFGPSAAAKQDER
jgi:hypothetical protein